MGANIPYKVRVLVWTEKWITVNAATATEAIDLARLENPVVMQVLEVRPKGDDED